MPVPSAKYTAIKNIKAMGNKGFRAHYKGPSTPGSSHPVYDVFPGLMGTNTAGEEKVLGYKYHGQNGENWRCFLVADFDDPIQLSPINPPTVGPVDENRQFCIKNIDHT